MIFMGFQELKGSFPQAGMTPVGRNLGQRSQNKGSLMQERMRNLQVRLLESKISVSQQVQINDARSPTDSFGRSAQMPFDSLQVLKQFLGGESGLQLNHPVEELALRRASDRIGLMPSGNLERLGFWKLPDLLERLVQIGEPIPQIRA